GGGQRGGGSGGVRVLPRPPPGRRTHGCTNAGHGRHRGDQADHRRGRGRRRTADRHADHVRSRRVRVRRAHRRRQRVPTQGGDRRTALRRGTGGRGGRGGA